MSNEKQESPRELAPKIVQELMADLANDLSPELAAQAAKAINDYTRLYVRHGVLVHDRVQQVFPPVRLADLPADLPPIE